MHPSPASTGRGLELWRHAQRHIAGGDGAEALDALRQLCRLEPGNTGAHLLAAAMAHTLGLLREAARHAIAASETAIQDAPSLGNTVMALLRTGEIARAHACMQHPLLGGPLAAQSLLGFASALQSMGSHADALLLIDRAIAAGADNAAVRLQRGIELMFIGRREEAEAEIGNCLATGDVPGRASLMLSRQRRQTPASNHIDEIQARLRRAERGSEDAAALEFALYKEYEDLERYEDAWRALSRGNGIMASRLRPDPARGRRIVEALIARTCRVAAPDDDAPLDATPQPIFIVGMPRSGTTLLDRMLGAHSEVTSAGELGDFARQLRWAADHVGSEPVDEGIVERLDRIDLAEVGQRYLLQSRWRSTTRYYVDKLPVNYQLAGLIARALPRARILHLVRDPMATCFSNYRAYFGSGYAYSYDLAALAAQYRDYRRLMRHWHETVPGRILDVDYARLTREPEAVIRSVMAFCGLQYEPDCLDLRRNRSPIATLSATQMDLGIRPPEDAAWRRYADGFSALRTMLDA